MHAGCIYNLDVIFTGKILYVEGTAYVQFLCYLTATLDTLDCLHIQLCGEPYGTPECTPATQYAAWA